MSELENIKKRFLKQYDYLKKYGMKFMGLYTNSGKYEYQISVTHPFIFDNRILPKQFEGVEISSSITENFPQEFDVDETDELIPIEVYYDPAKYIRFVDRCFDEIRIKLGNPEMTKEKMLDALSWTGNFSEHIKNMEELRINRTIHN